MPSPTTTTSTTATDELAAALQQLAERAVRARGVHVVDDFRIETTDHGTTRIVGDVFDASHLNGLLAHFTSMNVELVELRRLDDADPDALHPSTTDPNPPTTLTRGNHS